MIKVEDIALRKQKISLFYLQFRCFFLRTDYRGFFCKPFARTPFARDDHTFGV